MPIYTYECQKCGYRFEDIRFFDDTELPCPNSFFGGPPAPNGCDGVAKRVPSLPAPAQFNCSMPTYQRKKT